MCNSKEYVPQTWMQKKLLTESGYRPYCGNIGPNCLMPRVNFDKKKGQFVCSECGWTSDFPKEFIEVYRKKWNI